ncbi:hypothetical protein D3C72_535450 [compost metagenome]
MSSIEMILAILGSNGVTSYLTFLFSKKKYLAEANSSELENVEKSIGIYRGMVEDLGQRIDILSKNLKELRDDRDNLSSENAGLKKKVRFLEKEIQKLKTHAQTDNSTSPTEPLGFSYPGSRHNGSSPGDSGTQRYQTIRHFGCRSGNPGP